MKLGYCTRPGITHSRTFKTLYPIHAPTHGQLCFVLSYGTLVDFLTRTGFSLTGKVHKTREQFRHTRQAGHSFDFVARRHSSGSDLRRKMLR